MVSGLAARVMSWQTICDCQQRKGVRRDAGDAESPVCRAEWVRVGVAVAGSMLCVACVLVIVLRVLEVGLRERAEVGGQ